MDGTESDFDDWSDSDESEELSATWGVARLRLASRNGGFIGFSDLGSLLFWPG